MNNTHRSIVAISRATAGLVVGLVLAATQALGADGPLSTGRASHDAAQSVAGTKLLAPYALSWWSVDGGGGVSTGGGFVITAAIGQPDTGSSGGCGAALRGGLWSGAAPCDTPLFCDGFESSDTAAWSDVMP